MSENITQYGFELLKNIQESFSNGLTVSARDGYESLYLKSLGDNPGNGWIARMGWVSHHRQAFRMLLEKNGVQIFANPQVKVHDVDLDEDGFKRLSELQRKIRS